jgi:ABC-type transporter Mla maintaining outer membrane lipid asymmetry permease subunit MlaE
MRRSSQLSAAQLAALSGLGGVIAAGSFFATFNPWTLPHHTPPHFTALFALQIVLLLAGGVIAFRSATSLESGIANQRWPEAEIDSLRTLSQSPIANILSVALLIGFVLLAIIFPRFRPAGWSLYLLMLTFNFLRSNIRRKPGLAPESKWAHLSPIRSEHWGQH